MNTGSLGFSSPNFTGAGGKEVGVSVGGGVSVSVVDILGKFKNLHANVLINMIMITPKRVVFAFCTDSSRARILMIALTIFPKYPIKKRYQQR